MEQNVYLNGYVDTSLDTAVASVVHKPYLSDKKAMYMRTSVRIYLYIYSFGESNLRGKNDVHTYTFNV